MPQMAAPNSEENFTLMLSLGLTVPLKVEHS